MDLTTPKKDLLAILARAATVAERKSTMPVLSCVHLAAESSALVVSATDLYLSIRAEVAAEVKAPGAVAVPCRDLLERVRMMPDGPIHLSTKDDAIILKAVGSARQYTLRGIPAADFPPLPTPAEGAPELTIDAALLGSLIAKVEHAISDDATRAHLNSALVEWTDGLVRMVSTDGHRLAKAESKVHGNATATMLLSKKAVSEVGRLCESGGTVTIVQSLANAHFRVGGLLLSTRLVDAQFPPFNQVIPASGRGRVATVSRADFTDALKAVSLAASDRTGILSLAFAAKGLRVQAESATTGEGFDEIPMEYEGTPLTIGVNAKYLLDTMGVLVGENVTLDLGGDLDPMLIQADDFVAVVMPARI